MIVALLRNWTFLLTCTLFRAMNGVLGGLRASHLFEPSQLFKLCSVASSSVSFQGYYYNIAGNLENSYNSASFSSAVSSCRPSIASHRNYCSVQEKPSNIPSKETLFRVDWLLEHVVSQFIINIAALSSSWFYPLFYFHI